MRPPPPKVLNEKGQFTDAGRKAIGEASLTIRDAALRLTAIMNYEGNFDSLPDDTGSAGQRLQEWGAFNMVGDLEDRARAITEEFGIKLKKVSTAEGFAREANKSATTEQVRGALNKKGYGGETNPAVIIGDLLDVLTTNTDTMVKSHVQSEVTALFGKITKAFHQIEQASKDS